MTNIEKLHQKCLNRNKELESFLKCHDLISDILKLELGQGDIVEYQKSLYKVIYESKYQITVKNIKTKQFNGNYTSYHSLHCLEFGKYTNGRVNGMPIEAIIDIKKAKLIRHKITLDMVLLSLKKKEVNWNIMPSNDNTIDFIKVMPGRREYYADWKLRKDGKWLTLEDQDKTLFKFIIGVLS